jgi:hypothetical protein
MAAIKFLILILISSTMLLHRDIWNLEAGNFKLDQTRIKHWHARRQTTIQTQSSLAAQPHRTALAARPAGIGGSLTPSANGLAVTVTVQHRLSPHMMSMLANVSRMYAECFDNVATPLWPSVGVKPNTWKSWRLGVLRDSRMFRARQQGPKHLALECS